MCMSTSLTILRSELRKRSSVSLTPPPIEWGVTVDEAAIERLADEWQGSAFELPEFDYPGTPVDRHPDWWFDYVTMAVSVLACLWAPEGDEIWHAEHDGEWYDDAPGIFSAFTRLVDADGFDVASFADLSAADGRELFAGRGTLLLVDERVAALRSTAAALQEHWHGSAANLVDTADRNGTEIVRLLIDTLPAYVDRPQTPVGVAHFDKLAHLAAAIMAAGMGWHTNGFTGYDDFPVYPDYMLPRVFRHVGAMVYAPGLAHCVDTRQLIEADSLAEHAIRWATVYCGERLSRALTERDTSATGPALDYRLWSMAVFGPDADSLGEHHRTLTMRY